MDARKSAIAFAGFLWSLKEFGERKYFTDHHKPITIHGVGNSALACKM